jgi:hypothetical protein
MVTLLGKLSELETMPCGVQMPLRKGEEDTGEREFIRTYSIQEMTGHVRKLVASRNVRASMAKVIDTVLEQCVIKVGELEGKALRKGAFLRNLLNGDRDFLLLRIRLESKGHIVTTTMSCPACQEKLDVEIDIGDLDVYGFQDGKHDFVLDEKGRRVFEVEGEKAEASFRFPDGHDQARVAQIIRSNPIEAQHRMYQMCLVRWKDDNGEETEPFASNFFDKLPVRMLDWVADQFRENMPGPEMDLEVVCEACGAAVTANMESSDFLFPQTQTKRSKH